MIAEKCQCTQTVLSDVAELLIFCHKAFFAQPFMVSTVEVIFPQLLGAAWYNVVGTCLLCRLGSSLLCNKPLSVGLFCPLPPTSAGTHDKQAGKTFWRPLTQTEHLGLEAD